MDQIAGVGALALAVLWGAYYVPQQLRQRNQLVESRVEDRFSGSLRVLAVATRSSKVEQVDDCGSRAPKRNQLLTPPMGVVTAGTNKREVEGVRNMDQLEMEPGRASSTERGALPQSGVSLQSGASRRPVPVHTSRRETVAPSGPGPAVQTARAAAARRRLILTLALLALSLGTWIAAASAGLVLAVPLISTALLGSVLVLGRRAVVAGQRADAARSARLRGETNSAPQRRSRPTTVVVGRAVHGSNANTEMISSTEVGQRIGEITADVVRENASADDVVAERADTAAPEASTEESRATDVAQASSGKSELANYSVPRSTYVSKAAAPRREPAPLTPEDVTTPATASARAASARSADELEDLTPSPEGLGVDLNQILARRRAAGA